ncbi:ABC transporter permease subunit [Kamptonema cortianum]|nr:ABC transporter permease subunit [Geitlerinema splendidum]MDK3157697.1 ABC transporter permease subunit [Kamptonema cortianum]
MPESGPIADLSYRGYQDGMAKKSDRWKVIARRTRNQAFTKRSYWWLVIGSSFHYIMFMFAAYVITTVVAVGGDENPAAKEFFDRVVWVDQYLSGFQVGHFFLMAITLLVGAGSIANDHRSNALLVYLARPCTRKDYLLGKWMGLFVPVFVALAVPAGVFTLYAGLNFREYGFFTDDPWMIPKVFIAMALVAGIQTSYVMGVSALFRQGRFAGAAYAGVYVLSGLIGSVVTGIARGGELGEGIRRVLDTIHYCSVYGGLEGVFKLVINSGGSSPFEGGSRDSGIIPPPDPWVMFVVVLLPLTLLMFAAWRKVRAVEVVG